MQRLRTQADLALVIPGQMSVHHWLLLQGEEATGGMCGRLSGQCLRLANARGYEIGLSERDAFDERAVRRAEVADEVASVAADDFGVVLRYGVVRDADIVVRMPADGDPFTAEGECHVSRFGVAYE